MERLRSAWRILRTSIFNDKFLLKAQTHSWGIARKTSFRNRRRTSNLSYRNYKLCAYALISNPRRVADQTDMTTEEAWEHFNSHHSLTQSLML